MTCWKRILTLDSKRNIIAGSQIALCEAIKRGGDLRVYTEFRHNEHIDITSDNPELVQEVSEFPITYFIDCRWSAGIMSWRQPVDLPIGFGPPSMSFFLYNQDGRQAIARPYLDGRNTAAGIDNKAKDTFNIIPKYHQFDEWDKDSNAPCHNFIYDFDEFRYCVRDDWQEIFAHEADGSVTKGSLDKLIQEFTQGAELKVGISGLCNDLEERHRNIIEHEVFVRTGSGYYYTEQKQFIAATYPLVRVAPAIPLVYSSGNWG